MRLPAPSTALTGTWPVRAPLPVRPALVVAVTLLAIMLTASRIAPDSAASPRGLLASGTNLVIAAADLNLRLGHEADGATRAVAVDPGLVTPIGRQGARWLAVGGTSAERLRWAYALARQDDADRDLLQAAVLDAACSPDRAVRTEAKLIANAEGLTLPGRKAC